MKTCVILGNGPSFNDFPVDWLEGMESFGVNYCGFQPTYYVCVDHDILVNHHEEVYPIAAGAKHVFLPLKEFGTSNLYDLKNVTMVKSDTEYFKDERFFSGFTVTYVALKMAFYLGFERVHLWGVDHSPAWDHYKDEYPRGDTIHRAARMDEMFYHYKLAQRVYVENDRRIVNHSNHSRLDLIFPRK